MVINALLFLFLPIFTWLTPSLISHSPFSRPVKLINADSSSNAMLFSPTPALSSFCLLWLLSRFLSRSFSCSFWSMQTTSFAVSLRRRRHVSGELPFPGLRKHLRKYRRDNGPANKMGNVVECSYDFPLFCNFSRDTLSLLDEKTMRRGRHTRRNRRFPFCARATQPTQKMSWHPIQDSVRFSKRIVDSEKRRFRLKG